jgi:hypothetical protein
MREKRLGSTTAARHTFFLDQGLVCLSADRENQVVTPSLTMLRYGPASFPSFI